MRKLVIAVLVAVAVLLGLPGGPANAQVTVGISTAGLCTTDGNIVGECVKVTGIGLGSDPEPDQCQKCVYAVALAMTGVPAGQHAPLNKDLGTGVALLGQAAVAAKPDQAAELRAQAQAAFVAAGAEVGKTPLGKPGAGYVDPDTGAYVPEKAGWRIDVADLLSDGLNLLRSKPTTKAVAEAMNDFDAAYAEFVAKSLPND
jgi:hypothetical protein